MSPLFIDIWSDIACPWCYVGKRRFEAALARFPHRGSVQVRWRSFELDPSAPRIKDPGIPYAERLAAKYSTSLANADEMIRRMTATGAAEGLDFHFELIRPGNTFDAHRLQHFAAERGEGDAAKERLFRAYLTEGEPIGDRTVLSRLAGDVGLPVDEVRAMLASEVCTEEVRTDEAEARARGIGAVPHFLIGGRHGLSGAQPAEMLLQVLAGAWKEVNGNGGSSDAPHDGGACGPDGCS